MDCTKYNPKSQNEAPQSAYFDLNVEVSISKECPLRGKEKVEAQKQLSASRQALEKSLHFIDQMSRPLSPLSQMAVDLLSQLCTPLANITLTVPLALYHFAQVDPWTWHVLGTNLNMFCMTVLFFTGYKCIGIWKVLTTVFLSNIFLL